MTTENINRVPFIIKFQDDDERVIFEEFKKTVVDLQQEDNRLIRFFRARDRDFVKARDMLVANLKWKKEYNVESYLNWTPPKCLKEDFNLYYEFTGKDYEGGLVLWLPLGGAKGKEIIQAGHKETIFHFVYNIMESAEKRSVKNGISHIIMILGMENLTLRQIVHLESLQILYQTFQIMERNYPEGVKHCFILNTPWTFSIAFNFVKPVLAAETIAKTQMYDSNKSKWMSKLLEVMPKESIPAKYRED